MNKLILSLFSALLLNGISNAQVDIVVFTDYDGNNVATAKTYANISGSLSGTIRNSGSLTSSTSRSEVDSSAIVSSPLLPSYNGSNGSHLGRTQYMGDVLTKVSTAADIIDLQSTAYQGAIGAIASGSLLNLNFISGSIGGGSIYGFSLLFDSVENGTTSPSNGDNIVINFNKTLEFDFDLATYQSYGSFDRTQVFDEQNGMNDVYWTVQNTVPEPSSSLLFCLGSFVLLSRRKRY